MPDSYSDLPAGFSVASTPPAVSSSDIPPGFEVESVPKPQASGPQIRAAAPSLVDHIRRFLFGGPEGETALGRQFPSLSGARIGDTPTSELPAVRFEELVPRGDNPSNAVTGMYGVPMPASQTPLGAVKGAAQTATDLATGKNLEILAATGGLGAVAQAKPLLGRAVNLGLSSYFSYEMGKGASKGVQQAYQQYQAGDYDGMARSLGYASTSALFSALAANHAIQSGRALNTEIADAIDRHNENAALAIVTDAISAQGAPPPEPAGIQPGGAPTGKKPVRTRTTATPPAATPEAAPPPPAPATEQPPLSEPIVEKAQQSKAQLDRIRQQAEPEASAPTPTQTWVSESEDPQIRKERVDRVTAAMAEQERWPTTVPELMSRFLLPESVANHITEVAAQAQPANAKQPPAVETPPAPPSDVPPGFQVESTPKPTTEVPIPSKSEGVTPTVEESTTPAVEESTTAQTGDKSDKSPAAPTHADVPPGFEVEASNSGYPVAGSHVSGLRVGDVDPEQIQFHIDRDTFNEGYQVLPHVREVPITAFRNPIIDLPFNRSRDARLQEEIEESGTITPIVAAQQPDGHLEVVEGLHRLSTLARMGKQSIPAQIVIDGPKKPTDETAAEESPQAIPSKNEGIEGTEGIHKEYIKADNRRSGERATQLTPPGSQPTREDEDAALDRDLKEHGTNNKAFDDVRDSFAEARSAAEQAASDFTRFDRIAEDTKEPARNRAIAEMGAADARKTLTKLFGTDGDLYVHGAPAQMVRDRLANQHGLDWLPNIPKLDQYGDPIEESAAAPASVSAPAADAPTIKTDAETSNDLRPSDSGALATQLSGGSRPTGESGIARIGSRRGGRSNSGGNKRSPKSKAPAKRGPDSGVATTGVGDASERGDDDEGNFPPRSGSVASTRFEHDYRIPDNREISGSPETRAKNNLAAIRILRQLEKENRPATVEEQEVLAGYVGWGAVPQLFAANTPEWRQAQDDLRGLISDEEFKEAQRSTTNAHYTGDRVVDAIWTALEHLGAKPGMSWLEPAVGSGNFFGRQPAALLEGARRIGMDKDTLTASIAKYLYPDSGISVKAFEDAELPENYFDAAVSNVPFGNFGVYDPAYKNRPFLTNPIHNYFFAKSLDLVRPGGIVAFITSRYTMDGYEKGHQQFRDYIQKHADFLGAVRLPSYAFGKSSGTHVITDLIFLRKRLPEAAPSGALWSQVADRTVPHDQGYSIRIPTNTYYHQNPSHVLGVEKAKSGQFSARDYYVEGQVTPDSLAEALKKALPADAFQAYKPSKKSNRVALVDIKAEDAKKIGGFFFDDKGTLYRKTTKGSAEPVETNKPTIERIRGQLGIRNILNQLISLERSAETPDGVLKNQRQALNSFYDDYVRKYGPLSSRANVAAMLGDPDAPLLTSLEARYDDVAKTAVKGAIFSKRVFDPLKVVEKAADAKEALYVALNETGTIAWDRIAQLVGHSEGDVQRELEKEGLVFVDPKTRTWQTADEYLSGAVRTKLKEAQKLAAVEKHFQANVEALEKVQPEDIPPSQINALPGVTWVPLETYGEFAKEILNTTSAPQIHYINGEFHIEETSGRASKWGTNKISAYDLLIDTFNLRRPTIYTRTEDGPVKDPDATLAAREKQKQLAEYFNKWLFSDAKRADEITRIYNDQVNDLRLRSYDGSHLTLPEMSRAVLRTGDLEPYQKAAVWRQIVMKNVLLAHTVGSGKTFDMIAAGMELKRLGLIKRPMYVVPNSTLTGWQQQFAMLYPQKRVLLFTERDLAKKKRQRVMAQIATGEWDAVVVPHSSFQFIPVGDDVFNEHFARLEKQLEESIELAHEGGMPTGMIKRLEKQKETILTNLKERRNAAKQDQTVTWEQMGIDQLFVDESHEYKKLGFSTKQGSVSGIDPNGNQKTFDLLMKTRYTQKHGRGVVMASGTPVTNTMGELYNVMQYLIQPELDARGIGRFDEWAASFGRIKDSFGPKPEGGGYKTTPRFSKFVNVADLSQLFRSFADVLTSDMLDIPRPTLFGGEREAVINDLNEAQQAQMAELQRRAAVIHADFRKALPDNMAAIYGDAQKIALDARMMDRHAPDYPDSRVNQAVERILDWYKESEATKGTQLVFMDYGKPASAGGHTFDLYTDLINKLIARGIPADEIAHIYSAKTKLQRTKLFEKVNDGTVRVLLGSTGKMGTGVNVQTRAYGEHHLTLPHRPADLEQREGRIVRQGNIHPQVHIAYYATKNSLDELKFSNVARKARSFAQFMQGKSTVREMEDVDDMAPSMEQLQALSSGDPRVLRKLEVDNEINRLDVLRAEWRDQQWAQRRELNELPRTIANAQSAIEGYQEDIARRDKTGRVWMIGKERFEGEGLQKKAAAALEKRLKEIGGKEQARIGTAYGIALKGSEGYISVGENGNHISVSVDETGTDAKGFPVYSINGVGTLTKVENFIKHIEGHITQAQDRLDLAHKNVATVKAALDEPWPNQAEYDALEKEQRELFKALGGEKSDAGAGGADEIADSSVEADDRDAEEEESEEGSPEGEAEIGEESPAKASAAIPSKSEGIKPKDDSGDGSVTLGSGLGALQPYVDRFLKHDVIPTAKQAAELLRLAKDDIQKILAPASRAGAQEAALSVRANAAELARSTDRAEAALAVAKKFFDAQPPQKNFDFIDRVENGQGQSSRDLQQIADLMRQMLDTRRAAIQALGTGKLETFIEDYFPHIWQNPKQAQQAFANQSKRPLQGSKSFLKKRTIETFADGLALGLTPISTNPVELVLAKTREMDKYLTAHRILGDLADAGQLKFLRASKALPEGWSKIEDNVATVWGTPSHEGARQIEGYYIAPEPAARILNHYLSPGLRDKSALFRSYLGLANLINQAQLGFSAFHLGFTTMDVATSKLALAFYQGAHGDIWKGLKSAVLTPFSPFTNIMRGDKMLKEWYAPGTQGALIGELVDAMARAGGRAKMDGFYTTQISKKVAEAWRANNLLGALVRLPGALMELSVKPIMEYIVPRQKAGVFADLAQYELERLGTNASDKDVQAALARAWDSVDNRLGQLVYDNLFWHKVLKDLSMATVRSVGWNVGTIRELGGGLSDAAAFAKAKVSGNGGPDDFTTRMSYLLALQIIAGLAGAIAYYLWHGHAPHTLKDYYFPKDNRGRRWTLPTYAKDEYAWTHDPARTAQGKIHPLLALLWEMLSNKDYYNHPIANPRHPWVKQQLERAEFVLKQIEPIAYRDDKKGHHPGTEERILGFFGVKPAPKSLDSH